MTTPRPLKVFLSSTAKDLAEDFRPLAMEAIRQAGHVPEAMEDFPAAPHFPADECKQRVQESDAVVVVVAHRYGYVPPPELGGDGRRSITWLEIEVAQSQQKPIFAFLAAPETRENPWVWGKESDELNAHPEKAAEIAFAIQQLAAFKAMLGATKTLKHFTDPADLKFKIFHALSRLRPDGPARPDAAREWYVRHLDQLKRAPHFEGRAELLATLRGWVADPARPDKVLAIVAVGGTGKTAVVERLVSSFDDPSPFGTFVWSFDENERVEDFFRGACDYFGDPNAPPAGSPAAKLIQLLSTDVPHLVVLDAVERIQRDGLDGQPRGTFHDAQVRRFLEWVTVGKGTRTRVLLTSRFDVRDLEDRAGCGYASLRLEDLEPAAARAILRHWGVRGDDATLDQLGESVHRHALTLDVLGSYLGQFCDGDTQQAPSFDPVTLGESEPRAAALRRVLEGYASKLAERELDLLTRLAAFPGGATGEFLGFIVAHAGEVAGSLAGCQPRDLNLLLDKLRRLGLTFRYECDEAGRRAEHHSAHPFLRGYFSKRLADGTIRGIHEAVRSGLKAVLDVRLYHKPTDHSVLDRYEALIEHTRLAGHTQEAFDLYQNALGGFRHLGSGLVDYARGMRIVSGFLRAGKPSGLRDRDVPLLLNDWGKFAKNMGRLRTAREAFTRDLEIAHKSASGQELMVCHQNLADVELAAGRFPAAKAAAERSLQGKAPRAVVAFGYALFATAAAGLGDTVTARRGFAAAAKAQQRPACIQMPGVWEADYKLSLGLTAEALEQARAGLAEAEAAGWEREEALYRLVCGSCLIVAERPEASACLAAARRFGDLTGNAEVQLRAALLAAAIESAEGNYPAALAELDGSLRLAEASEAGKFAVDIQLARARCHLVTADPHAAYSQAKAAAESASHLDHRYAWGHLEALDLCGQACLRLGRPGDAAGYFRAAVESYPAIDYPGLPGIRGRLAAAASPTTAERE